MKENNTLTFKLYYALKEKPKDIDSLYNLCKNAGYDISARSIYRHIEKLELSLDPAIEILETEIGNYNKKTFYIKLLKSNEGFVPKNNTEWMQMLTHQLLLTKTAHQNILNKTKLQAISENILFNAPLKVRQMVNIDTYKDKFNNSSFGQVVFTSVQQQNLVDFVWCMQNKLFFKITEFEELTNKEYLISPKINELLIPIKIIYHRNDFILMCHSLNSKITYTLEFDKIKTIAFTDKSFAKINIKTQESDGFNFGFHPAISEKIHTIKLLFPKTPGGFVMNRFWHHSQQFTIKKNGDILMTLNCRLCIELIGWIMLWMDNVQVISPKILNKIIAERLENMVKINSKAINPINNSKSLT